MSKGFHWIHLVVSLLMLSLAGLAAGGSTAPLIKPPASAKVPPEVAFMRGFIEQINPALAIEDADCVEKLPRAIHEAATEHALPWQTLFVIAWQESDFDCHAKNRRDRGGAYGPFQIRRLWEPVIGDPRENYFDPQLATDRASKVLVYYRQTGKFDELLRRRFINPLLCLYNTGESQDVNMRYCQSIGDKARTLKRAWSEYVGARLVAVEDSAERARLTARRLATP
ncbi:MAG: transglycosylase SLT domain-containing protein [Candidatus Lambdaproteobacteria bacterium]|nr:transglycosylase SLT domain-containing protein [Candidatus Lambdaproteobacteria bacterium]